MHVLPAEDAARADGTLPRSTPNGRILAYIQGRQNSFWLRQTLTVIGAATLWAVETGGLALWVLLIGLTGDVVEIWLNRRARGGLLVGFEKAPVRLLLLAAVLQALGIATCAILVWRDSGLSPLYQARFFAAAFLTAAIINAGLSRPYFRAAADLRILIYGLCTAALVLEDLVLLPASMLRPYLLFTAAVGVLLYISVLFIGQIERFHSQRRKSAAAVARMGEENRRLALVAKYANDSIILCGPDGRIQWVNEAFSRVTGYPAAEALGHEPGALLNAPETSAEALDRLTEARAKLHPVRTEILNRTRDGGRVWIETSIIPILDSQGQHQLSLAVERDISEAKLREAELARARATAEAAVQAKARFLANMSHEIRTPMNGVLGVAELLAETRLTPQQAEYVETIMDSGRALLDIINDILDLAKLESGKAALEARAFSLSGCLQQVQRILGPVAAKKGLRLTLAPLPEGQDLVLGDEGKLRQVLLNLAGNAVKFTPGGEVGLSLRRLPDAMVEVEVSDTGIGIAADRLGQIFESFTQADATISRQFGGTGLGLTISAMLAERMGGRIRVRSELGKGSVFTLSAHLPPAPGLPAEAPAPGADATKGPPPPLPKGWTVLVAEDNRTNMMIVRQMLAGQPLRLIEAVNGREAVELCARHDPDLILMDISMPVMDGLAATRALRQDEARRGAPRRPILALTANAFGEDREACHEAGLDGFLVKPLSRRDLFAAIAAQPEWRRAAAAPGPAAPGRPADLAL